MKYVIQMMVGVFLAILLVGCQGARHPADDMRIDGAPQAGAQNMNYMYRSPPPNVAARLAASPR